MLQQFEIFKKACLSSKAIIQKQTVNDSVFDLQEQKKVMLWAAIGLGVLMLLSFMVGASLPGIIFLGLAGVAGLCFSKLYALIVSKEKEVK